MSFSDRADAGRRLARRLEHLRGKPVVVLGLPRGGVPVAAEVAAALGAPLDVIVVRKLGVPFQPELGMGAIGEDGVRIVNADVVRIADVTELQLGAVEARERAELERRALRFRGGRARLDLEGRVAVVVDDGIATGSTARAACRVARADGAARVVLAVPVAPPGWTERFAGEADELVAVETPAPFFAIGQFYEDFAQTSDDEVIACLRQAPHRMAAMAGAGTGGSGGGSGAGGSGGAGAGGPGGRGGDDPVVTREAVEVDVSVSDGTVELAGHLSMPEPTTGLVLFAHGSGSSRLSPRNRYVAGVLNQAGLGTLLFDLLSPAEERDRANVFDIDLLGRRLGRVTAWASGHPVTAGLPVGYFGASTGAAAALWAASEPGSAVAAVVSRGGRPDLAGPRLASVRAPTLLIVGSLDHAVLTLNRDALVRLGGERRLTVIPGATHLFEEPGTLRAAAEAARDWFLRHLVPVPGAIGR